MDDRQALAIVTALANGVHPATGEVFPADSPYQSPEVIRALFVSQRALETQLQPQSTQTNVSKPNESRLNESKPNPSNPNASKPNAGKPWSVEEDKQLLAAFDAGRPLVDIAREHGRTAGGVRARLEKHGRLEPSPATRWPVKDEPLVATQYKGSPDGRSNGGNGRAS